MSPLELPERPKSLQEFMLDNPDSTERSFYGALDRYRLDISTLLGVTVTELHEMSNDEVISRIDEVAEKGEV